VGLLAAVAQHDDEQEDWQGRGGHYGLTPAGAPANFTQKEFSLVQARGVLAAARFQGQWRSLLTSMHLSCLYESLRGSTKEITAFLDELHAGQLRWRRALKLKKAEAQAAYDLLHWTDRLSLILCRQELPEMGRTLEIYQGPDGRRHFVRQPHPGGPVVVEPWPFAADRLEVSVEASVLTQLQFRDDAQLAQALRTAPVETLRWEFRRA
jgi:4-amino-4-deoxy-L-arabinose transferase-like glycosyltransferase